MTVHLGSVSLIVVSFYLKENLISILFILRHVKMCYEKG